MGSLVLTGNTSGSVTVAVPDVAGSNTATIGAATGTHYPFTAGTAVASTSGTSIDFTGIPSWVKRITVMFKGVSTSGTNNLIVQLGAGSLTTSLYVGSHVRFAGAAIATSSWAGSGIEFAMPVATYEYSGSLELTKISGDAWIANGFLGSTNNAYGLQTGGNSADLGGSLAQLRITTVGGTQTFDAGSINILYE